MSRIRFERIVAALLITLLGSAAVCAQNNGPRAPSLRRSTRPAVSPYLNLAAAGGNPDAATYQYYNQVLPQQAFSKAATKGANAISDLDKGLQQQRMALQQSQNSELGTTGHRTMFMNTGGYFEGGGAGGNTMRTGGPQFQQRSRILDLRRDFGSLRTGNR